MIGVVTLKCSFDGRWRIASDSLYVRINPTSFKADEIDLVTSQYLPPLGKRQFLDGFWNSFKASAMQSGMISFDEKVTNISFEDDKLILKGVQTKTLKKR